VGKRGSREAGKRVSGEADEQEGDRNAALS
jgi:hypothetical protein